MVIYINVILGSKVRIHTEVYLMEYDKKNFVALIGFIGTLLMIIGVFLSFVELEALSIDIGSYTGWDVYSDDMFANADYNYAGLVTLIAGILALITSLLPMIPKLNEKPVIAQCLGALSFILSIIALILLFLFYGTLGDISVSGYSLASADAGIGLWLCIIGALILAVGGIVEICKRYIGGGKKDKAEPAEKSE